MTADAAGARAPGWTPGRVPLDALLRALAPASAELVVPAPRPVEVASVVLVDADDLTRPALVSPGPAELWLLAGVPEPAAAGWLTDLAGADHPCPAAVLAKEAARSPGLARAARAAGVALVAVHPRARWEQLLTTVREVLDRSLGGADSPLARGASGVDTDLAGLAQTLSTLTRGMVSIEDEHARVLAYSASDEAADELRRLSILGRAGPPHYLERLRAWGVYDRLGRSDDVVEVPADLELGLRRRLAVSMRETLAPGLAGRSPRSLGTIWVQEGAEVLAPDAPAVLRGASAVAARLITRARDAPSNEAVQIQRLLGAKGGGVDVPSLAAALAIPTSGPAVVVGFDAVGPAPGELLAERAAALRLHASAYARESLVTTLGDRIYLLLPHAAPAPAVSAWTSGVLGRLRSRPGSGLRAAVAAPVNSLSDVPLARAEVDRVLDQTPREEGVTTLADARTSVLLGEILDLVAGRPALRDPRLDALLDYDARHGSAMVRSVETYLRCFGDVRAAAAALSVHPNTLRYRLRRAEELLGITLDDPDGRLLVELQLALLQRRQR